MTCRTVPMSPSLCTCGVVLDITQWHGDDELGNDLCPTCSGCGCEPNERNERVSDPTDTPSTDGAPGPEERPTAWQVIVHLFDDGWEFCEPEGDADELLAALAAAGLRIVEEHPAPEVGGEPCGDLRPGDESLPLAAGVPALDDDTRREVERIVEHLRHDVDVIDQGAYEDMAQVSRSIDRAADLLAAAYGVTDG